MWAFTALAAPSVESVRALDQRHVALFVQERRRATDAWVGDEAAVLAAWRASLPEAAPCAEAPVPAPPPPDATVPGAWWPSDEPAVDGLPAWMENVSDARELGGGVWIVARGWDGKVVVDRVTAEGQARRLGIGAWGWVTFGEVVGGAVEVTTSGLEGRATYEVTATEVRERSRRVCPVVVRTVRVPVGGENVPVTLVRAAGPEPGPDAPLWVDVYGGFGLVDSVADADLSEWIRAGGWWATVHVRGGGERGRAWHEAGSGVHKVQAALDLNAAVAGLHAAGIGTPAKTVAWGESNGGLVVAAAVARAPGSYGAVVSSVGPHDLVDARSLARPDPRSAALTGSILDWPPPHGGPGWWVGDEYPRPWVAEERDAARTTSPVYTTPAGPLPPVYLLTGEWDPVVNPVHSVRLAAAWADAPGGPVLLQVGGETHGSRYPTCGWGWGHSQHAVREQARAFVLVALGLAPLQGVATTRSPAPAQSIGAIREAPSVAANTRASTSKSGR